jgi:hypothetical protein
VVDAKLLEMKIKDKDITSTRDVTSAKDTQW